MSGLGIELLGGKAGCSWSIGVTVLSAFFGCSMHQGRLWVLVSLSLVELAYMSYMPSPPCSRWHLGTRWCRRVPWHGNACIGPCSGIGEGGRCCCSAPLHSNVSTCWSDREVSVAVDPLLEWCPRVVKWLELGGVGWCLHLYEAREYEIV